MVGPFRSTAPEAREDSADRLLMPEATAAEEEPEPARALLLDLARILALRLRMASDLIAEHVA